MTLRLSVAAVADLQHIARYTIQQCGEKQENVYLNLIYDRFSEIENDPHKRRFRNELHTGSQSTIVGKHVIFFKVHEDVIQVARILHQSMDFSRHLDDQHFDL